jgi:hypothetical protein
MAKHLKKILVSYLVNNLKAPKLRMKDLKRVPTLKKLLGDKVISEDLVEESLLYLEKLHLFEKRLVIPKTSELYLVAEFFKIFQIPLITCGRGRQ